MKLGYPELRSKIFLNIEKFTPYKLQVEQLNEDDPNSRKCAIGLNNNPSFFKVCVALLMRNYILNM